MSEAKLQDSENFEAELPEIGTSEKRGYLSWIGEIWTYLWVSNLLKKYKPTLLASGSDFSNKIHYQNVFEASPIEAFETITSLKPWLEHILPNLISMRLEFDATATRRTILFLRIGEEDSIQKHPVSFEISKHSMTIDKWRELRLSGGPLGPPIQTYTLAERIECHLPATEDSQTTENINNRKKSDAYKGISDIYQQNYHKIITDPKKLWYYCVKPGPYAIMVASKRHVHHLCKHEHVPGFITIQIVYEIEA